MEKRKGYAWIVEENRKYDEKEREQAVYLADRMIEADKIQGCCSHIPYVAGVHRYTLMHLCAMAGVNVFYSFTAANLRRNWMQLPPEEFEKLCHIVEFTETLHGEPLPAEVTDQIIDEYIQAWLLS
jgi:hypothetical protein